MTATKTDPIEIKVNVGGDVDDALGALGLGQGEPRQVWFLDDFTEGIDPLPLLNNGVVVRLRRRINTGKEQSTVKLRPCRRSQLAGPWDVAPPDNPDYRIEGDWSRKRHTLAASFVAGLEKGTIDRALAPGGDIADLISADQRDFLSACGAIRVAFGGVGALRPIAAIQWEDVSLGNVKNVAAERWTVDNIDTLELSIRITTGPDDARTQQDLLEQEVLARGLPFDENTKPKTERVMRQLAGLTG
jgi:hypothetical protein